MALSVEQQLESLANKIKQLTPEDRKRLLIKAKVLTPEGIYHPDFFREETVQLSQRQVLLAWAKRQNISYIDEIVAKLKELQYADSVIQHFKGIRDGAHFRTRWYESEIARELDVLGL